MSLFSRFQIKGAVTPPKLNAVLKDLDEGISLPSYTKAQLNASGVAAKLNGRLVLCSDGAAGPAPCLAWSNGTAWKVIAIGATIT